MTSSCKTPSANQTAGKTSDRPRLTSEQILRGNSAVEIEHAGQYYLLRITRENKLILTK